MDLADYYRLHGTADKDYFDTLTVGANCCGVVRVTGLGDLFPGGYAFYRVVDYSAVKHWKQRSVLLVDIHSSDCRCRGIDPREYEHPTSEYPVRVYIYGSDEQLSKPYPDVEAATTDIELFEACEPLPAAELEGDGYARR